MATDLVGVFARAADCERHFEGVEEVRRDRAGEEGVEGGLGGGCGTRDMGSLGATNKSMEIESRSKYIQTSRIFNSA